MVSCKGQISPPSRRHFYLQNSKAEDFSRCTIFHLTAGRRMWAKKLASLSRLSSQTSVCPLLFSPFCWWFNIFYLRQTCTVFSIRINLHSPDNLKYTLVSFQRRWISAFPLNLEGNFSPSFRGKMLESGSAYFGVPADTYLPYFIVFTSRYSYTFYGCRKCVYLTAKSEMSTYTAQF